MASEPNYIHFLADHVALAYHEARNVRHLVKAKVIDAGTWRPLISLPNNRVDAWRELQLLRAEACSASSVNEVLAPFERKFQVSLEQLATMFANAAWRGSPCGGNAWESITLTVIDLARELEIGQDAEVAALAASLRLADHNTGAVAVKLRRLDQSLVEGNA